MSFHRLAAATFASILALAPASAPAVAADAAAPASFAVGVEVFGQDPAPLAARGLRAAYLFAPDDAIELTYVEAKKDVLMADFRFREAEIRRKMTYDSVVQWGYGLGFRDVRIDYDVFVTTPEASAHVAERHQAFTANAHFGLEFAPIAAVAIGSDLVGVSVPLYWSKNADGFPKTAQAFEEDPKKGYLSPGFHTSYQLLRSYIEVRF